MFLVGIQTGAATLENSMTFLQKVKNKTTLQFSSYTTRYLPKGYKNTHLKEHMHPVFKVALSTIAKLQKEPKHP